MTLLKATPTVFCIALLGAAFSPNANADDHDKKTTITFSGPVEIPGVHLKGWGVLPAGTYVFKLVESNSNRHIVQIFNKDETQIYATVLAIPNYRLKPTSKTLITFNEGIRDRPEAIRAWFYPGANWGEEFVYPKAKAVELAKVTNVPVLAVVTEVPLEVEKPEAPAVVAQLQQAPLIAVRPTGEEVEIAQVVQSEPAQAAPSPAQAAPSVSVAAAPAEVAVNTLPATASNMPLIAAFGLLALSGAVMIGFLRKRTL
jgi:LPXTG-motif cell wall-anchored protein